VNTFIQWQKGIELADWTVYLDCRSDDFVSQLIGESLIEGFVATKLCYFGSIIFDQFLETFLIFQKTLNLKKNIQMGIICGDK
jgi:hypothetical protein